MTKDLRIDLAAILLEECYGMREDYAYKLATGYRLASDRRFAEADVNAVNAVAHALDRIDARCSKILG